jgi:hypothetical protein
MSEEMHLDTKQCVCPLSLMLGVVQSYRTTERRSQSCLESRPAKGTDKFAAPFYAVLHAPKGEDVVVEMTGRIPEDHVEILTEGAMVGGVGTYTKALQGMGQGPGTEAGGETGAQALKFTQQVGLQAREAAVQRINAGEIRAPKKNWDKTYGPELSVTYTDPETGETSTYQIGGGTPLEDLKKTYPDLYNQSRPKAEPEELVSEYAARHMDDDDDDDDDYERSTSSIDELQKQVADVEVVSLEEIEEEFADEETEVL